MPKMLGRFTKPWCCACHAPAGFDCGDSAPSKRQRKRQEDRAWKREVELAGIMERR